MFLKVPTLDISFHVWDESLLWLLLLWEEYDVLWEWLIFVHIRRAPAWYLMCLVDLEMKARNHEPELSKLKVCVRLCRTRLEWDVWMKKGQGNTVWQIIPVYKTLFITHFSRCQGSLKLINDYSWYSWCGWICYICDKLCIGFNVLNVKGVPVDVNFNKVKEYRFIIL